MTFVLMFILILAFSCQTLFARLYTESRDGQGGVQFSVFYAAMTGIITLLAAGFSYKPSLSTLILGLVNAAVIFTYNMTLTRSSHLGSYAFLMICVLSGGILIPMVYDVLYLHSSFTVMQWIGVFLMLAAFVVLNADGLKAKKDSKFLLCCAVLFVINGSYGVFMNLQQNLNQFTQRYEMIITTFLGMALITTLGQLIFSGKKFVHDFRMSKKSLWFMVCSSVSAALAVNIMMYMMQHMNVTILSAVDNGGVLVFSALFAFVIFKEKPVLHTILGLILALVSIILLSL